MLKYKTYTTEINNLKESGNFRELKNVSFNEGSEIEFSNKNYINFSGNDYLGIAGNKELSKLFIDNLTSVDLTSVSSRLLSGNEVSYLELENTLVDLYKRDSALVFSSGYHLNIGVIPAIALKGDLIISDKLNHASIVDGVRLSGADVFRFKHADLNKVDDYLTKNRSKYNNVWIITESVFSMDGDFTNLKKLVELKQNHSAFIYLDEAHGVGVLGDNGLGLAESEGLIKDVDILTGTFGKALASYGAFLVCDSVLNEYLINKTRTLIFTTALPPFQLKWTNNVLKHLPSMKYEREKLTELSAYLISELKNKGFNVVGNNHIISIIIGDSAKAVTVSESLLANGIFALAVRPPTVSVGTSRIRISLNANLTFENIDLFVDALKFDN
ncbi:MAG: 8-amino-7-oxononanoate synthase [Ichthyobacteriaceae bacterium]|nr:8-amino-7-oxononanoate synthase [Ichthyobacteriaceae bacterium]